MESVADSDSCCSSLIDESVSDIISSEMKWREDMLLWLVMAYDGAIISSLLPAYVIQLFPLFFCFLFLLFSVSLFGVLYP